MAKKITGKEKIGDLTVRQYFTGIIYAQLLGLDGEEVTVYGSTVTVDAESDELVEQALEYADDLIEGMNELEV